jgi:hypothetical protein
MGDEEIIGFDYIRRLGEEQCEIAEDEMCV